MMPRAENALALESQLVVFSFNDRLIFQALLWPVVVVGLLGNGAVLCRIALMRAGRFALLKPIYRCALVSFAVADLTLLVASGSYTLAKLSSSTTLLWQLPDWTCSVIPYLQTVAILAGSLTLAGIAVDRYRALSPKSPTNEGPKWSHAVCFHVFVWLFAMAASSPIIGIYEVEVLTVIATDYTMYDGRVCVTEQRHTGLIYTGLFIIIFAPLALVFLAVHVLLALNVRRGERLRSGNTRSATGPSHSESTDFSSVSSGGQGPQRSGQRPSAGPRALTSSGTRRKRRTVNVILLLIFVFLAGRLPSWTFLLCKQHLRLAGPRWHYLQTAFTGLSLANAALDPFLYAFLSEALSLLGFVGACCARWKKSMDFSSGQGNDDAGPRPTVGPVIVPRGPYNL